MHRLAFLLALLAPNITLAQAPNLNPVFPCGAQQGSTVELTLIGQNLQEPLHLHASFPIQEAKFTSQTDSSRIVATIKIPSDTPLGWHTLRLVTQRGVSNLRPFCIDELPQVLLAGSPFSADKAQELKLPCVTCGTIQSEQKHYYAIKLSANQRLCAEILGRRLGSQLDPSLALYDATGQQVAFSDDSPGLQKDARFAFTAPSAGGYRLEVRDVAGAGGNDYHYRLRLGDFPLASTTFPLAIQRGSKSVLTFSGPLVEQTASMELTAPADPALRAISVTPRFTNRPGSQAGWPVQVMLSDLPERAAYISRIHAPVLPTTQAEKMNQAISLAVPGAVSGVLQGKGEKHYYRFKPQSGVRYLIQATTQELGSPALVNLVLSDARGKSLANSNPEAEVPHIDFTSAQDGDVLLTVEHLHYGGGPDQSYRLAITPYRPTFTLHAAVDRLGIARNNGAVLIVQAVRAGYNGPIELKVEQPDSLSGSATIPAGETSAMLPITAAMDAPLHCMNLKIIGTGRVQEAVIKEYVSINPAIRQAFVNLPYPPVVFSSLPVVNVQPGIPFSLVCEPQYEHGVRGLNWPVRLRLSRQPGFQGEVEVQSIHLTGQQDKAAISPVATNFAANQSEIMIKHQIGTETPDQQPVAYLVKSTVEGREMTMTTIPMKIKLVSPVVVSTKSTSFVIKTAAKNKMKPHLSPFLMHDLLNRNMGLRASLLDMGALPHPFSETSVEVTIARQGGYTGPVQVRLINLPDKVVAGTAIIVPGQDRAAIPVVASGAQLQTGNNVQVEATALTLANQKSLSSPISFSVK